MLAGGTLAQKFVEKSILEDENFRQGATKRGIVH